MNNSRFHYSKCRKTNPNVVIVTVIHSGCSQAIHLLYLIKQTVVESAG